MAGWLEGIRRFFGLRKLSERGGEHSPGQPTNADVKSDDIGLAMAALTEEEQNAWIQAEAQSAEHRIQARLERGEKAPPSPQLLITRIYGRLSVDYHNEHYETAALSPSKRLVFATRCACQGMHNAEVALFDQDSGLRLFRRSANEPEAPVRTDDELANFMKERSFRSLKFKTGRPDAAEAFLGSSPEGLRYVEVRLRPKRGGYIDADDETFEQVRRLAEDDETASLEYEDMEGTVHDLTRDRRRDTIAVSGKSARSVTSAEVLESLSEYRRAHGQFFAGLVTG